MTAHGRSTAPDPDQRPARTGYRRWHHAFTVTVAVSTLVLIVAGGLVTSTGSGLSVPDWPLSYGSVTPPMVGGVFFEHGHRMVATTVGILTIVLAIWTQRVERRRWVKRLAWIALGGVIVQGVLGGMTVLFLLPTPVSVAHACVAEAFFLVTVTLAVVTSGAWHRRAGARPGATGPHPLARAAGVTTVVVYLQLVLGAIVRHTGSGLAVPDFPMVFGGFLPPTWNMQIAVHLAHRLGAIVVSLFILRTVVWVVRDHGDDAAITRPAMALLAALPLQITLGATTIWLARAPVPTTAHVATGAFMLAMSLMVTLMTARRLAAEPALRGDRAAAEPAAGGTRAIAGVSPAAAVHAAASRVAP